MKHLIRFIPLLLVLLLPLGASSAQRDTGMPNEIYFQVATIGEWTMETTEIGNLTLHGINPTVQYTITSPRLWSVSLDSVQFNNTWSQVQENIWLEAILSFGVYNIRLLLTNPVYDLVDQTLSYEARVLQVINFTDETTKSIPASFEFPTLTIQPTLDFTLALMDAATSRLEGTRNAEICTQLAEAYASANSAYTAFIAQGTDDPETYQTLQLAMIQAYKLFTDTCLMR